MTESKENEDINTSSIEDNLPMVNYIMLHRVYDMLSLIADILAKDPESRNKVNKMIQYHDRGFLLGPAPSYNSQEETNE